MIRTDRYYNKNLDTQVKQKRDKLYIGKEISHISVNDIQSTVKDNIENYSKFITEYVNVINQFLPEEVKLNIDNMIFDIKRTYGERKSFKDDGNTSCEGFSYNTLWAFTITDSKIDEWSVRQGFIEKCLYFTYEDEERLFDNKVKGSRFFSIYLAGIKLPREENNIVRIDYNNANYSSNSVLSKGNIVSIVLKIQDMARKINLIKELESINLFE